MNILDFLVQLPFSWRQQHANGLRSDMTRERFIATLAINEVEERAASLLWEKLVEVSVVPDFKPCPDDDLLRLYGLAEEDLDEDIIMSIFETLGLDLPSPATLERIGKITSPKLLISLLRLSGEGQL